MKQNEEQIALNGERVLVFGRRLLKGYWDKGRVPKKRKNGETSLMDGPIGVIHV